MQLTIEEAQTRLTDLITTAEAGTEVILTRDGHPAARLVPVLSHPLLAETTSTAGLRLSDEEWCKKTLKSILSKPLDTTSTQTVEEFLKELHEIPFGPGFDGTCAARSQDFLYDDDGLPA